MTRQEELAGVKEGDVLARWIEQRGALPVEQAVDFLLQACEAIAEAHALGIIHRDLKPANLFVAELPGGMQTVKVLDFGISKLTGVSPFTAENMPELILKIMSSPRPVPLPAVAVVVPALAAPSASSAPRGARAAVRAARRPPARPVPQPRAAAVKASPDPRIDDR